jgi:hypothetical protein
MEKLIFEGKCVKVFYDSSLHLGKVIWNGNPSIEEYKQPYEFMLDFAKTNQVDNFLADTINQGVVSPEARKWFETSVFPRAVALGLKRGAVVSSANAFKKYYLNAILSAINKFGVPVKIFSDTESAVGWFKSQEKQHA